MSFFYFQRLYQKVSESKREVWEDPMAGIYHSGRKVAQAKLQSKTAFRKVSAALPKFQNPTIQFMKLCHKFFYTAKCSCSCVASV